MTRDLYAELKKELMLLWDYLRAGTKHLLPSRVEKIQKKLSRVKALSIQIGGQVQVDAEKLEMDINQFLSGELGLAEINKMFQHALKLEQDTREL